MIRVHVSFALVMAVPVTLVASDLAREPVMDHAVLLAPGGTWFHGNARGSSIVPGKARGKAHPAPRGGSVVTGRKTGDEKKKSHLRGGHIEIDETPMGSSPGTSVARFPVLRSL